MKQEHKDMLHESACKLYEKQLEVKNLGIATMPDNAEEATEQFAAYHVLMGELLYLQLEHTALRNKLVQKEIDALQPDA